MARDTSSSQPETGRQRVDIKIPSFHGSYALGALECDEQAIPVRAHKSELVYPPVADRGSARGKKASLGPALPLRVHWALLVAESQRDSQRYAATSAQRYCR